MTLSLLLLPLFTAINLFDIFKCVRLVQLFATQIYINPYILP